MEKPISRSRLYGRLLLDDYRVSTVSQSPSLAKLERGKRALASVRLAMYRQALRIRMVEEEIVARYPEQEMRCPTHICIGQEGPPVGVSAHLKICDYVFSAHRSHGHYLAKGGDLKAMIAELYGRSTGCARGVGGSQHLVDLKVGFLGSAPILASTISVGVGAAWAVQRRGEKRVVVIYFGDAATEEGAFHEAMNFAGVNRLPVVFVCENNLYSVHSALDVRQPPHRTVKELGPPHGVEALAGDGNDIDSVWQMAEYAIGRARSGLNPVLLEFFTYRWKEHCGPGEDLGLGYRDKTEYEHWHARCPISSYRKILMSERIFNDDSEIQIRDGIAQEIDAAFKFAKASAFPPKEQLMHFVFPEAR
jgi:TPP-dependent pyruvate/acetoin dehydrogenase alpha subunit